MLSSPTKQSSTAATSRAAARQPTAVSPAGGHWCPLPAAARRGTNSSTATADSPRVTCGNQLNIRAAVRYSSRTTMHRVLLDGDGTPAHVLCERFWHGTGTGRCQGHEASGTG